MKKYLLEVCVDSVESALNAEEGGADRLELCANLVIGGTTPGEALFRSVKEQCHIPIHVLIRPRFGDFLYSDHEFAQICREVELFGNLGADGVVIGCLLPDGSLDLERMRELKRLAGSMNVTLHRAFDMCKDPVEALHQSIDLNLQTILTSGQKNCCMEGRELLGNLVKEADGRIDILIGGGVDADVIETLIPVTGAVSCHMSGKRIEESGMIYRKEDVSMGIPGMNEYEVFRTDAAKIRMARQVLDAWESK